MARAYGEQEWSDYRHRAYLCDRDSGATGQDEKPWGRCVMKAETWEESASKKIITDKNVSTRQHNCGGKELEKLKIKKSSLKKWSFSTAY